MQFAANGPDIPEALLQAHEDGVMLALSPSGNIKYSGESEAVDRWLPVIREHKAELLDELRAANDGAYEALPDAAAEARRQRLLAMLRESPGITYAVVTDTESDPDAVIVALAIQGRATCELLIPRDRYDGVLLLRLDRPTLRNHSLKMWTTVVVFTLYGCGWLFVDFIDDRFSRQYGFVRQNCAQLFTDEFPLDL